MTSDSMDFLNKMLLENYRYDTRGVECGGCGLTPSDMPDEVMMDSNWLEYFTKVDDEWFCLGCGLGWDA